MQKRKTWANKNTTQKMKVSIKDFFTACDQICSLLQVWSHLPKKCFMENLQQQEKFI